jgi:outer membrane protein TolC
MRAESLALALAAITTSCAPFSIRGDLDHVRRQTRVELSPRLEEPAIDHETHESVRRTLSAPLGAEDAVRVAIANNRGLRATLRELGVYRGRLVQAGLVANPSVGFDLRHPNDPSQPVQVDLSLEWDVTHSLLAPARAGVARAELEAARVRAAASVIELGFRVRTAVFSLQAAQSRLALATRALDTFAAGRDAARALTESGNTLALDRATHEAAYESARVTVAQIELDVLDRRESLQRLLSTHGDETRWSLRDGLAPVPEAFEVERDVERRAITASLSLSSQRSALEAMARRTGLVRAEGLIPDVSMDVHVEQDGAFWEVGGGATVRLPLFDRRQGDLLERESAFDAAIERYIGSAADLRSHARMARNRALSAHLRARQYATVIVPARRRVMEQWMLQYNAMQVGVFALLQARRDELDAQLRAVDTAREFWVAKAALDALYAGHAVSDGAAADNAIDTMISAPNAHGGH